MCTNLVTALSSADAFGNRKNVTLNTPLLTYCDNISTVLEQFNTFCLVPASKNVSGSGEICDPTDKPESEFLFNQMASGNIDNFSEIPILWQSAPILHGNTDLWVDTGMVPGVDFPVPYANLQAMSFSDNGSIVLGLNTSGIVGSQTATAATSSNVVISFVDGMTRNAGLPGNTSWKGRAPFVAVNPLGTLRVVGEYVWTQLSQTWTKMSLGLNHGIEGMKIATLPSGVYIVWVGKFDSLISKYVAYKTTDPSTVPLSLHADDIISSLLEFTSVGFLTLTPNQQVAVYPRLNDSVVYAFDFRDITTNTVLQSFVPTSQSLYQSIFSTTFPSYQLTAMCLNNVGQSISIMVTGNVNAKLILLTFNTSGTELVGTTLSTSAGFLDADPYNKNGAYNAGGGNFKIMLDGSNNFVTVAQPFTASIYQRFGLLNYNASHNGILFTTNATDRKMYSYRTEFNTDVQLYSNLFSVSDLGSPTLNTADWNPGPTWFMGTQIVAAPTSPTLPYPVPSKHFRYRINMGDLTRTDPNTGFTIFAFMSAFTLTRSNDYRLLKSAQTIRLFNDGNVQALNSFQQIIWETNMHDGTNNTFTFIQIDTIRPGISTNGIYATVFDDVAQSFTMYYYSFNNALFTEYGKINDTIFNNSLTSQTNFCYDNLQTDPENQNNIKFSDGRCTCIGGERLFNAVFLNVDLMPPSQRALLLDTLPCIMLDCSRSRVNFDPTNTFRLLQDKCTVPITICSTSIRAEDQSSIGGIGVIQDCGTEPLPSCVDNAECPVGTKCVNNQCKAACATNEDCTNFGLPGYECDAGVCINNGGASNGGLSDGEIAAIAISVIVAVTLVAVLCWYFLVYKKANP